MKTIITIGIFILSLASSYAQSSHLTHPSIKGINVRFHENSNASQRSLLIQPHLSTTSAALYVQFNYRPAGDFYVEGYFVSIINGVEKRVSEPLMQFYKSDLAGQSNTTISKESILSFPTQSDKQGSIKFKIRSLISDVAGGTQVQSDWEYVDLKEKVVTTPFKEISSTCDEKIMDVLAGEWTREFTYDPSKVTITDLGDSRYSFKAINNQHSTVDIKVRIGVNYYTHSVSVGLFPPKSLSAPSNVFGNNEYYVTLIKSDPTSTTNVTITGISGLNLVKISETLYRFTTPTVGANTSNYPLQIKATETNACGTSLEKSITIRLRGGTGPNT